MLRTVRWSYFIDQFKCFTFNEFKVQFDRFYWHKKKLTYGKSLVHPHDFSQFLRVVVEPK